MMCHLSRISPSLINSQRHPQVLLDLYLFYTCPSVFVLVVDCTATVIRSYSISEKQNDKTRLHVPDLTKILAKEHSINKITAELFRENTFLIVVACIFFEVAR